MGMRWATTYYVHTLGIEHGHWTEVYENGAMGMARSVGRCWTPTHVLMA